MKVFANSLKTETADGESLIRYGLVGRPDKERALVGRILREFYRPAPDGLCGNDDCGQMSAWYLRRMLENVQK